MDTYIVEVFIKDASGARKFTWEGEAANQAAAEELAEGAALEDANAKGVRGEATVEIISAA
ncbi:hypothetical protein [Rugamonas sp.]|uniref:hypothetical protein n=1 Tax=Rugamonas sp. TaxID=1926287 RepID=UPI0025D94CF9|nr:hypothetical protein [Rugamonas sp.]